jgi:hypothetical protein
MLWSNNQIATPSTKEAPISKFQTSRLYPIDLIVGAWNFPGAWNLILGNFRRQGVFPKIVFGESC